MKLLYFILLFIEGYACGSLSTCVIKAAYPQGNAPWYISVGMLWFAYVLWGKLKTKN